MIEDWRVAGTMSAADLGTQAAAAEGFGLPIAETLACGTPVAGTDHPVIRQVVGPGGWLADAQDLWATGHEAWWRMPDQDVAAADLRDRLPRVRAVRRRCKDEPGNAESRQGARIRPDQEGRRPAARCG